MIDNQIDNSANEPDFKMQLVSVEVNNFKSFSGKQTQASDSESEQDRSTQIIGPFTRFTGIIGPNGVGKSNIFDAIAFALNISMAPGKARHTRDLCHIPKKVSTEDAFNRQSESEPSKEFFVKLNFLKIYNSSNRQPEKVSLQRGLRKRESEDGEVTYFNEYIVNDNEDKPLLFEEYKALLKSVYHLDF